MTAVNIFVESDAAYLLTDRAHYDQAGVVLGICRKVLYRTAFKMAVAFSGKADVDRIAAALDELAPVDQEDALASLPKVADAIHRQNFASSPESRENAVQLFAVLYRDARHAPEAWFCSTDHAYFGANYTPGELRQVAHLSTPQVNVEALFVDVPVAERPRTLMEAQRRVRWGDGLFCVGGGWDMTAVTAQGVLAAKQVSWPDKIGEKITPTTPNIGEI